MTKTVSEIKVKKDLEEILAKISSQQDEYVIESNGKPTAVIVSVEEYNSWKKIRNEDFSVLDRIKEKSPYATDEEIQDVLNNAIKAARA